MRRTAWIALVLLLLLSSAALAASVRVITQEATIRQGGRFFAPVVLRVPYGEVLEQLGRQGDWLLVRYQGTRGWIHISAVKEQKFRLSSLVTTSGERVSRQEVALAGKGFTPEVERAFRSRNPRLRYDLVAAVQSYRASEAELQRFIQEGKLKEPGEP